MASGARTGMVQSTTDEQGIRHSAMQVSYRTDQPEINNISHTLDAVGRQPGSQVIEHGSDRAERQQATASLESSRRADAPQMER